MIKDISFCIMNYSHSKKTLKSCIESIRVQRIPEYEILVCSAEDQDNGVKYFHKERWAKRGEINKMRNYLCGYAKKEFIVLIDAGVELTSNWYTNIKPGDCFDLVGSRLVTQDDKRVIDWAYQSRMTNQNLPLPLKYDEWSTKAYISGILMVLRYAVWEKVKFNENLLLDQNDDADFCLRASEIGFRIGVFPKAVATYHHCHNTQVSRKYLTFDESLKTAVAIEDEFYKGENVYIKGNYDQAIKHYKKVLEIAPDNESSWEKIGWAYYFMSCYSEAINAFDKAIMANPKSHFALRGRGWTNFQKKNYDDALEDLSQALEYIHPTEEDATQEALRGQGWSYYHKNSLEKAIKSFNKIMENKTLRENAVLQDVFRGLGWSYYKNGNFNKAMESFDKAYDHVDPNNKVLRQEILQGHSLACQKQKGSGSIDVQQPEQFIVTKRTRLQKVVSLMKQTLKRARDKFKVTVINK